MQPVRVNVLAFVFCSLPCRIADLLAPSHRISVFSVDTEGRNILGEYTDQGEISPTASQNFNLKLNLAVDCVQALALDVKPTLTRDRDDGVERYCCTIMLYKTGVSPSIHVPHAATRGVEEMQAGRGGGGEGKRAPAIDMPLFGVLVCIREMEQGTYTEGEITALQALAHMSVDQMLIIKDAALTRAGRIAHSMKREDREAAAPEQPEFSEQKIEAQPSEALGSPPDRTPASHSPHTGDVKPPPTSVKEVVDSFVELQAKIDGLGLVCGDEASGIGDVQAELALLQARVQRLSSLKKTDAKQLSRLNENDQTLPRTSMGEKSQGQGEGEGLDDVGCVGDGERLRR